MYKSLISILLIAGLLGGCQDSTRPDPRLDARPDWIENPGDGAAGSASTHARGRHAQEELAISRARTRLAARYGVSVENVLTMREKAHNDHYTVTSESHSRQVIRNDNVKAHVRAIWRDPIRDVIWAWVYPLD